MRYTPKGESVTVRVKEADEQVQIVVENPGPPIPPQHLPRLFDRFYRVEGTGIEGSGLGLAIVREIAELHRADASLRPRAPNPGGERPPGALARVVFPVCR